MTPALPPRVILLAAALAVLPVPAYPAQRDARPAPLYGDITPVRTPDDLRRLSLPNTTIESVTIDAATDSYRIVAVVTHPPAPDRVTVWVALPLKGWNGRFRGNGGGGFTGGRPSSLDGPVRQGFATAATDTGHEGGSGDFALAPDGRLRWQEIRDNAHAGIHAMTVVGKALTEALYGRPARYSYFVGGSTGGRQGMSEAQRYPEDYDGIVSNCPAINWHRFVPAGLWPQAVMVDAKHLVSKARLDAATAAAVRACDAADGVVDGVIDDPLTCTYDPGALVGTPVEGGTFTTADADVIRQIWQGPRGSDGRFLWHGLTRGTDLFAYAGTTGAPLTAKPFSVAFEWFRYFLVQSPKWTVDTLTRGEFELLWTQSVEQYGEVFGTDNPDLSRFRDRGGKLIITHGLSDQLIPPQGSIDYYERVQRQMGGAEAVARFARLFLMPGLDHGFRGPAPTPNQNEVFNALIAWVENNQAPGQLRLEQRDKDGKLLRARPAFPYPKRAVYKGSGSSDDPANYVAR